MIHPTAIVSPQAEIGSNVEIGPFTIVEANVKIADGCQIGAHVTLAAGTILHKDVKVFNGAVLATIPQDLKFAGEITTLEIGERTVIREFATLNRGTTYSYNTKIGSDCLVMAYCHVAHDCQIGNHVIMANNATLAGHIEVGDWVNISGLVPVHQFVKIGSHSFVGGGFRVPKDVPPYIKAMGEPLRFAGINSVGLKRRGFSPEAVQNIADAYRILYRSGMNISEAVVKLEAELGELQEIKLIIDFVKDSLGSAHPRGLIGCGK